VLLKASIPNGARGKAPAAVDFEAFGIWNPAECVLKRQLLSFKTSKLEPNLLSLSGYGTDVNYISAECSDKLYV